MALKFCTELQLIKRMWNKQKQFLIAQLLKIQPSKPVNFKNDESGPPEKGDTI